MYLMAEFFEKHDKTKFEIHAFSFGPDKNDGMRQRAVKAFEHFHDVRTHTDEEIVHLSRSLEIDIAFDLKGCTQGCRPRIFALRAAPIQINYLGYPGSMGVSYMDYIIADRVVIPEHLKDQYSEKVIYLDGCYQPQDTNRKISTQCLNRKDHGLPEDGFIYCCFNNNYKITPDVLNAWCAILKMREESYLWLLEDNQHAAENLIKEFKIRDVDPSRIIFAKRTEISAHLARQRLANVFLDTFPCNAHTTASDAIAAQLELITYPGNAFAARVALSIVNSFQSHKIDVRNINQYELFSTEYNNLENDKPFMDFNIVNYVNIYEKIVTTCHHDISKRI